jgi:nucleoid-associated protein YgaU
MNYKLCSNAKITAINILLILISASCRLEVPIKEMTIAKSMITRAVEVKSEKYAPDELKKAKDELIKSHDAMKTDDIKAAKKAAEESIKYSKDAITKSLPLLADDNLNEAKNIYKEAKTAFAEKYAPEEFSLAGAKIDEAESLISDKEYWESYLKSGEAITNAASARDKALSNISSLEDRVKIIGEESKKLEAMGSREFAPDEMKAIDSGLDNARRLLGDKNLFEASEKIIETESALDEASSKTWKGYATAKIKAAEEGIQKLSSSPSKDLYANDLQKAGALVKESKDLFDKKDYRESGIKSEEALGILNSIAIAVEKSTEAGRIEGLGKSGEGKGTAATEYIVKYDPKNRDCLWRIALYVYKDARLWPLIYVANKDRIKDPDLIFPGQKLVVPALKTEEKSPVIDKSEENSESNDLNKKISENTDVGLNDKDNDKDKGKTTEDLEKKEEVKEQ